MYDKLVRRMGLDRIMHVPSYLHVTYSLMQAMIIEEPNTVHISYPFATVAGLLPSFRKAYQML